MPPIRVAVVGCGAWGRNVVRNFAEFGALAAICDHHADVTADLSARFGVPILTETEILADSSISAVAVVTQPSHHAHIASAALAAGKHVFVEKPLAADLGEATALVRQAGQVRRVLMVGHILRYHPAFAALLALVRDGRLGAIRYIRSHRFAFGAVRREEDVLACLAPHDLSMVLALAGDEPATVSARAVRALGRPIADMASIELRFPCGAVSEIAVSWLHPEKEQRLAVIGERGMAVFDDLRPWPSKLVITPWSIDPTDPAGTLRRSEEEAVPVQPAEPLAAECRHFLDCIATGRAPTTDGAEALRVMAVLKRARDSLNHADAALR
jgi:UDP-2-acetamido-3-amino-2,3-dideoxy-glucuronate N-acetyltransferase